MIATTAALTPVENIIPDVSNQVKKNYDAKILDIESKYFTTADYNKVKQVKKLKQSQTLDVKIKRKGLVDKSVFAGFINNADLDKK